jgi:hypothetical protein
MAASGYTPLQLYHSTTPTAEPAAGNLVTGELALNVADGYLFYKNVSGVVENLAGLSGYSGISGYSGFSGISGYSGFSGSAGGGGSSGTSGYSGYSGYSGFGISGYSGYSGINGAGGTTGVFVENETIVTTNYTLTAGKNAESVGPITINPGVTVTIPNGQRWVVL